MVKYGNITNRYVPYKHTEESVNLICVLTKVLINRPLFCLIVSIQALGISIQLSDEVLYDSLLDPNNQNNNEGRNAPIAAYERPTKSDT